MSTEIERKYLVTSDEWREAVESTVSITQGYLHVDADSEVRVRVRDGEAVLTVKRGGAALERVEVEVPLDPAAAEQLLSEAVVGRALHKRRHLVPLGAFTAEVDEYAGELDGLVVVEIELPDTDTEPPAADWLGTEVTGDERYYNATMATRHTADGTGCGAGGPT